MPTATDTKPRVHLDDRQGERAHFRQYDQLMRMGGFSDLFYDRFPVCPLDGCCSITGEVWPDPMNDALRCVNGHRFTHDSCYWLWRKRRWTYEDECKHGVPALLRVEFQGR